jgi:hypothetical protein
VENVALTTDDVIYKTEILSDLIDLKCVKGVSDVQSNCLTKCNCLKQIVDNECVALRDNDKK